MGGLPDRAGNPAEAPAPLKRRKFVEIDRDNFNKVMESIGPRLAFQVQNRLTAEDSKINVELRFSSMDDFDPIKIVQQVESLRKLHQARQRLSDLLAKLDGNDRLEQLLQEVVESTEQLKEIQGAVPSA